MAPPYPTAYQIEEMFANRDVPNIFHNYLADPIDTQPAPKTPLMAALPLRCTQMAQSQGPNENVPGPLF